MGSPASGGNRGMLVGNSYDAISSSKVDSVRRKKFDKMRQVIHSMDDLLGCYLQNVQILAIWIVKGFVLLFLSLTSV
jgi:hypothetical protein